MNIFILIAILYGHPYNTDGNINTIHTYQNAFSSMAECKHSLKRISETLQNRELGPVSTFTLKCEQFHLNITKVPSTENPEIIVERPKN